MIYWDFLQAPNKALESGWDTYLLLISAFDESSGGSVRMDAKFLQGTASKSESLFNNG